MILPPITEIAIVGVFDPGEPNQERIIFRPLEAVNTAQFSVIIGVANANAWTPVRNMYFWLREQVISPPSWIVLYTGTGADRVEQDGQGNPVHTMFWGNSFVLFGTPNAGAAPLLIRMSGVEAAMIRNTPTPPAGGLTGQKRLIRPPISK